MASLPPAGRRVGGLLLVAAILAATATILAAPPSGVPSARGASEVRILSGAPAALDPAAQGDVLSAAIGAQLFETLTSFDSSLTLRPALARSWDVEDAGRRVTFHLRPDLTFSDGTRIGAADVVRSWLRLIDPASPSPLASLMSDVVGADDYRTGQGRAADVGLTADGLDLTVRLERPAADFPSIAAASLFAVVPPGIDDGSSLQPGQFVSSGGYLLAAASSTDLTLRANPAYWAGTPRIETIHVITEIGGRSPVAAFEDGTVDYAPIGWYDASWIRYDAGLGPQLRSVPSLSVEYLGFDASRPPFSDVRVRQAFGAAVDWRRIVSLASPGDEVPATSLVPPGIPDRGSGEHLPAWRPQEAEDLLAAAGYPGGHGFPEVTMVTSGTSYGDAFRASIEETLGIRIAAEVIEGGDYYARLQVDPPAIWTLGWIADYPGANDFLGVLLGSESPNNVGRWSSAEFDAAIAEALAAADSAGAMAAYERAQAVVASDVPVVPLAYGDGWALSRDGLLGAGQNGLGIPRFAALAWSGS
jgi:oligopeptide transport system substrate-binding protein